MTFEIFKTQVKRLNARFKGVYDEEFLKLLWSHVRDIPNTSFVNITNHMIGQFHPDWPPKLSDFIEQAMEQRKIVAAMENAQAQRTLVSGPSKKEDRAAYDRLLKENNASSILDLIFKKG